MTIREAIRRQNICCPYHRRLGIISDNLPGSKLRVEGFMDALKAAGVGFDNPANLTHTSATLENYRKAAAAMLAQAQEDR